MGASSESREQRFNIIQHLGSGGAADVHLAYDKVLGRRVALKRLRSHAPKQEDRKRLLEEARRAARLSHPNIAVIHDVVENETDVFIVMEYVPGGTLRKRLSAPLGLDEFYTIAFQCLEAVSIAHEQGIIHADLKPENVLMSKDKIKICDFGLARVLPCDKATLTSLGSGSTAPAFAGTPGYMAPEVLRGEDYGPEADIFALGVMFYEILAGVPPFAGATLLETCANTLHTEPVPLNRVNPSVPKDLAQTVHRMLAKSVDARFTSAADALLALRAIRAQAAPWRHPAQRKLFRAALIAVVVLILVLIGRFQNSMLPTIGSKAIPSRVSLVVMPFRSRGGTVEQQLMSEGLIDTVTAQLTTLTLHRSLQVFPAEEVRNRKVASPDDARKEFSANLVLTGDIQWAGDIARVNYTLVDTATHEQVRAGTVTEPSADPFHLQDQVVQAIVNTLQIELLPRESAVGSENRTPHAGAQELYLQGRGYLLNYDRPENIDHAVAVLERSLREDPNYARAYAALGDAYWRKFDATKSTDWVDLSRSSCERAAGLAPRLPEAQGCLGTIALNTGMYEEAARFFQKGLDAAPTEDSYYAGLARSFERLHRLAEAENALKRMIELRPEYWAGYNSLGAFYARNGRTAEAVEMFKQVVNLAPDSFRAYANLGGAYYLSGRYPEAVSAYESSMRVRPNYQAASNLATALFFNGNYPGAADAFRAALKFRDRDYRLWAYLASAEKWAGHSAAARAAFQRSVDLAEQERRINPRDPEVLSVLGDNYGNLGDLAKAEQLIGEALMISPNDASLLYRAAVAYEGLLHNRSRALELLARAVAHGYDRSEIERSPTLQTLRSDPRYRSMVHSTEAR